MAELHQLETESQKKETQKEADEVFQDFTNFFTHWELQSRQPDSMEWEILIRKPNHEEFLFTWIHSKQPTKSQRQKQLRMCLFDLSLGNLAPGPHSGMGYLAMQDRKKSTSS
jgi:hypothetical protein